LLLGIGPDGAYCIPHLIVFIGDRNGWGSCFNLDAEVLYALEEKIEACPPLIIDQTERDMGRTVDIRLGGDNKERKPQAVGRMCIIKA
jgi:hypothetical protein